MNLIEVYKKKKASGEFLNPTSEKLFIETAIQTLSEIIADEKNSPQSMAYRKAHEANTYFIHILSQIEADIKRVNRMNDLRKSQKNYWSNNSDQIAAYRKQVREYNKNKSLNQK